MPVISLTIHKPGMAMQEFALPDRYVACSKEATVYLEEGILREDWYLFVAGTSVCLNGRRLIRNAHICGESYLGISIALKVLILVLFPAVIPAFRLILAAENSCHLTMPLV